MKKINIIYFLIIYSLFFLTNLNAQTIEFKRPGLSMQFTALEYTGTYHFPVNNKWFDPEIQYQVNNEQLYVYREVFKKIIVINQNPDTVSIVRNSGLILKEALEKELATWSSVTKAKKRKVKPNTLKYMEDISVSGLKKDAIYLLTKDDFANSKNLMKILEQDENSGYKLKSELEVLEAAEDAYFISDIDGSVIIVGSNQRSTLYGIFDFISKIEKQKSIEELQRPAGALPKYRLANLWNGINANESNVFLNNKKLFYNIMEAGNEVNEQFIYDKLAQMLAYYQINGIILTGTYAIFNDKYTLMLKLFSNKMKQYGIDTYLEINPSFAQQNEQLILQFMEEHKSIIKGIVINNIIIREQTFSEGSSLANNLANKGFIVIWRDEPATFDASKGIITYRNPETNSLNEKVIIETIDKNAQKYNDNMFGPVAKIDNNKFMKSFVLHWWGKNPYADYTFSDEKSNIAFIIYFYTKDAKRTVQFIDSKINSVQP